MNGSKISGCEPHMIVLMMCLVDQHRLKELDLNISLVSHPSVYLPPTTRNYALGIVLVPNVSCAHLALSANWELLSAYQALEGSCSSLMCRRKVKLVDFGKPLKHMSAFHGLISRLPCSGMQT